MSFTICTNIWVCCVQVAMLEHVWFLLSNIHAWAIPLCLQAHLYILWHSITVLYHGKRIFLIPSISQYEHQIAFLSISVLLMIYSTLFVKMLCCAFALQIPCLETFHRQCFSQCILLPLCLSDCRLEGGMPRNSPTSCPKVSPVPVLKGRGQLLGDYAKYIIQHF